MAVRLCPPPLRKAPIRKKITVKNIPDAIERTSRFILVCADEEASHPTLAFSCGARSASKLSRKKLLEKHAIAPSAARLCSASSGELRLCTHFGDIKLF